MGGTGLEPVTPSLSSPVHPSHAFAPAASFKHVCSGFPGSSAAAFERFTPRFRSLLLARVSTASLRRLLRWLYGAMNPQPFAHTLDQHFNLGLRRAAGERKTAKEQAISTEAGDLLTTETSPYQIGAGIDPGLPVRLMVDPSFLFSEDGLAWLEDDETVLTGITVPGTFMEWLRGERDLDESLFVAPDDLETVGERRDRLFAVLRGVEEFRSEALTLDEAEAVRLALLASGDPLAELYADEWSFLQSQSSMIAKLRHPLDAFRDAGAVIVEFGRRAGRHFVEEVIPAEHVPAVLTRGLMVKAAVKWIIIGGAAVGGGTLGGIAGTAIGGPLGGYILEEVGRHAAEEIAQAAVVAIDP